VADSTRDADADVIASGREPRRRFPRSAGLVWLLAGADGTADLAGYAWTGSVADPYWMALDPSPVSRPPGLHGQFAQGKAAPFPAGQAPCAAPSRDRQAR
jgi:hypothetical protein